MTVGIVTFVLIISILGLLLLGIEVAVVLGVVGLAFLVFGLGLPMSTLGKIGWNTCNSFTLTAIPLFILMGQIFLHSGVSVGLFKGVDKWIGRLPGGLACSVVGGCTIFAAISGSSPATAATLGSVALPEMEKRGYNMELALGSVAGGGTLGILIPPSITMIIYAVWQSVSVGELFIAGVIPGLILGTFFILLIMLRVGLQPALAPMGEKHTWKEKLLSIKDIGPWIGHILFILGGTFAGIMTATEAGAIGAMMSMIFALAYRKMSFQLLKWSLLDTLKVTVMIMYIVVAAKMLAFGFAYSGVTTYISSTLLDLFVGKYAIMATMCLIYLVLGCFLDTLSMLVLTLPLFTPIITELGFSNIWFGVFFVICAEAGMITPPVGLNLFVLKGISNYRLETIIRGAWPFLVPMIMVLAIITVFPQVALWLPSFMIY